MESTPVSYPLDIALLRRLGSSRPADAAAGAPSLEQRMTRRLAWDTVLVSQTVDHAVATVPYYRARYGNPAGAPFRARSLAGYREIEPVGKEDVAADPHAFASSSVRLTRIRQSTGTSSLRVTIYGCEEEIDAREALFAGRSDASGEGADRDLVLRILGPMRRASIPARMGSTPCLTITYNYFTPPFEGFDFDDLIVQCLSERYALSGTGGRVSVLLFAPAFLLEMVTERLLLRGVQPHSFGVRSIAVSGSTPTPRMRELARDVWRAPLVPTYSCTEILGQAPECPCRELVYHFDETIYPEVVDADGGAPCGPGEAGLLLLTSTYPFQQAMPFLRYRVGDVAEVAERPCACGSVGPAVRILGRAGHCIDWRPVSGRREYLGTVPLEAALNGIREVPHLPFPRFHWELDDTSSPRELRVSVEVNHDAFARASRQEGDLAGRITGALRRELPPLDRSLSEGAVQLRVTLHRKGDLKNFMRLKG